MKRAFDPAEPELMDRPQAVSDELRVDLRNLRALNRWFGSYRLVRHFLEKWIRPGDNLRVVDLATGSGDIPRLIADHARIVGAQMRIDAVDFQESTLSIARELSADYPEIAFNHADVLEFGAPQTYDVVFCSLALHHFSELDAIRLLRRCREISRGRILVADLRRGPLASAGVWLLTALIFREPMTRVDARLSAARAFSFSELRQLAVQAGWQHFSHERFQLARQAIWNEKPAGMTPSGLSLT